MTKIRFVGLSGREYSERNCRTWVNTRIMALSRGQPMNDRRLPFAAMARIREVARTGSRKPQEPSSDPASRDLLPRAEKELRMIRRLL